MKELEKILLLEKYKIIKIEERSEYTVFCMELKDMKRNKYKDTHLSINIIKNMIAVKNGDEYNEVNVYTIIGVNVNMECHKNFIIKMS